MPTTAPEISRYRIIFGDRTEKVITMPTAWKITFGPNVPGARRTTPYSTNMSEWGWCFRVYSNKSPQRLKMCLPNVQEFYEEGAFEIEEIQRDPETQLITNRQPVRPRRAVRAHAVDLRHDSWPEPSLFEATQLNTNGGSNGYQDLAGSEQVEGNGPSFQP